MRAAVGLVADKEDVLNSGERVQDDWLVLGQSVAEEGKLWRRRVWLRGQAGGRMALLLDFSHGGRRFEQVFMSGSVVRATLVFYPSAAALRALLVDAPVLSAHAVAPPLCTLPEALEGLAQSLAAQPWQWPRPLVFSDGVPVRVQEQWFLHTPAGQIVPLDVPTEDGWQLLALGGGQALHVAGEWDGRQLQPLSAWQSATTSTTTATSTTAPHNAAALVWMQGVST